MRARPQQVEGPWDSRPGAGWGPQTGRWDSSAAPSAVHSKPAGGGGGAGCRREGDSGLSVAPAGGGTLPTVAVTRGPQGSRIRTSSHPHHHPALLTQPAKLGETLSLPELEITGPGSLKTPPSQTHLQPHSILAWGGGGAGGGAAAGLGTQRGSGRKIGPWARDWPCRDAGAGGDAGLSRALSGPSQPLTDEAEQGLPKTLHPPPPRGQPCLNPPHRLLLLGPTAQGGGLAPPGARKAHGNSGEGLTETLQRPPTSCAWRLRMSGIHKQERLLLNKRTFLERTKSFQQKTCFLKTRNGSPKEEGG